MQGKNAKAQYAEKDIILFSADICNILRLNNLHHCLHNFLYLLIAVDQLEIHR
jgi:hypothetical protein